MSADLDRADHDGQPPMVLRRYGAPVACPLCLDPRLRNFSRLYIGSDRPGVDPAGYVVEITCVNGHTTREREPSATTLPAESST